MPKSCPSGLTKTKDGYSRTIGYYINDGGRRVPRKFRLGHDRTSAKRRVEALEDAWESLRGERGQKVWTDEAIKAALDGVAPTPATKPAVATPATQQPNVPVPVFPSRPYVPRPLHAVAYTLPTALDEFCRYFSERTDISRLHRDGTVSRIKSRHIWRHANV